MHATHFFSSFSTPPPARRFTPLHCALGRGRRFGFSLTELLVVIGIIVLLVGILLVALGHVQSKAQRTRTESTMTQFLNACTTFQQENGRFPGVIPETVLHANPQISSTENALLDLLGGFRVVEPTQDTTPDSQAELDFAAFEAGIPAGSKVGPLVWATPAGEWRLVVDLRKIGEGPIINGKPNAPYFTPGPSDLARAKYPPAMPDPDAVPDIPDLVDGWGQPILYLRQVRPRGPLCSDPATTNPQFLLGALGPYVLSTALGEMANDQTALSILNTAPAPYGIISKALAHGAVAEQPRGAICLISAGEDGVFFSATDGPGSATDPIDGAPTITFTTITDPVASPKLMDEFDDIRMFGGS